GHSVKDWPAFPDSSAALAYLKQHYKLAILSNIDRASFAHSNRKLGVEFDLVVTAQDVGSYKPTPRNFEVLLEGLAALGVPKTRVLHTAESLFHDHVPAKRFGLATAWVNRRAGKDSFGATRAPDESVTPDWRVTTLSELADLHRKEIGR
ncbi:MAG: HAD hydrolase-like protein, partial [Dongiaceae bacterium]